MSVPDGETSSKSETPERREQTLQERLLRESEARFRNLVEKIPSVAVQGYDAERRIHFWNAASEALYGYSREEAIGKRLDDLILPETMRAPFADAVRAWVAGGPALPDGELLLRRKDGSRVSVYSSHSLQQGPRGPEIYCMDIDLSAQQAAAQKMQQAASVFEHANDGIMITSPRGDILDVNAAFTRITGYTREDVLGENPRILKSGRQDADFYARMWKELGEKGTWQGEVWNRRKDGALYPELLTISTIRDASGAVERYVALFSDISARKEHEQQLEFIAFHDALTGLPNRALLTDRLTQAMARAEAKGLSLALVYLDLDAFKEINDTYGHDFGDELLVTLAERFRKLLRRGDTVARLGGDEYAFVLVDLPDVDTCVPLLHRLLAAIAKPVEHDDLLIRLTASMGVSVFPQADRIDAEQLLRQADQAMYQAKLAGQSGYRIFDSAYDRALRTRYETLQDIRRGLQADEFVLYYQPKVDMREGRVVGVEALLRWRHPQRGVLAPDSFLAALRNDLLMVEVGDRVIAMALEQAAAWRQAGTPLPVSVNVDARQLEEPGFVAKLKAALAANPGAHVGDLEIEVLETGALEESVHTMQVLQAVQELGIPFSLDDFGTGYSSLVHLKRLPIDTLKIDQGFVRNMLEDPEDLAILEGVIGLAEAFRCKVIAEGVETEEHGELLLKMGCVLGQGYAIARPMPAADVAAWCAAWTPHASWQATRAIPHERLPLLFGFVEHRAWFRKLRAHLHGQSDVPPVVSPERLCTSGRLEAAVLQKLVAGDEVCALQGRCATLHADALALVERVQQGGVPTAAELAALEALHAEVLEALQGWSEGEA